MKTISRRDFLVKTTKAAGLAYPAFKALDLIKDAPAHDFNLNGDSVSGNILILGAGLAGLTAAYELSKLGYKCMVLEARDRPGGRCFSVRNGSVNQETTNHIQKAAFDKGQYFNAGPSRIPHNHKLVLEYCKELGVSIEVYNNINESAYFFSEGNGPISNLKIRIREIHNDIRGYTSELLAKAADQQALDAPLTREDTQKLIHYLRAEGALDMDNAYKGSERRGYLDQPGAGDKAGSFEDPYTFSEIISSGLLEPDFYNVPVYTREMQMPMFQAVGGMDAIAYALYNKVKSTVHFNAEVSEIRNRESGVEVIYSQDGREEKTEADLCICTIPLPVLSNIRHNFSSNVSRAIDYISYIKTGKIGLQFKRRFWEEDENVYGGITYTNNDLTQIFYPSNDYLSEKGTLIGCYNFNEEAERVGEMNPQEREDFTLRKGSLIHPQYSEEFEHSFSISWHKTRYNMGGWALYNSRTRESLYKAMLEPDKNVYFAGEHMTYLNAWMAGAFESARSTVTAIHNRLADQHATYPATKG